MSPASRVQDSLDLFRTYTVLVAIEVRHTSFRYSKFYFCECGHAPRVRGHEKFPLVANWESPVLAR